MSFLTSVYFHLAVYNFFIWFYIVEGFYISFTGSRFPILGL